MLRQLQISSPGLILVTGILLFLFGPAPGGAAGADEQRVEGAFHWWVAGSLAAEGDADGALENFERAVEFDPDEPFLRVDFADFLFRQRLMSRAQKQVDKAVELSPDEPVVLRAYGQIQLAQAGRSDAALNRAVKTFERLREVEPEDINGMLTLAQLYQGSGEVDKAIAVYEELVRNNNDNRQLKRLLVDALTKAGKNDRAREVLEEVLELEQESLDSRLRLAELESEKGNHGAAIEILSGRGRGVSKDPRLVEALAREHFLRSQAPGVGQAKSEEDLQKALELLQGVERSSANRGNLGFLEANVLASMGKVEEAVDVLRGMGTEAQRDLRIPLFLSRLLEAEGNVDEAAELLEGLVSMAGARPGLVAEVRDRLARLEARRGRWLKVRDLTESLLRNEDEAVRLRALSLHLDSLVELDDASGALQSLRAEQKRYSEVPATLLLRESQILAGMGKPREALKILGSDELLADSSVNVALGRARIYQDLDRFSDAESTMDRFAEDGAFEKLFLAGQFFSNPEGFETATRYFREALESNEAQEDQSKRAQAHFWLGQSLERSGRVDEAAEQFKSVLSIREDDSNAMNYLGYMWVDAGQNLEEGLALIQRAVDMEPKNGAYADSLGWAFFRLGRLDEARAELERAAELTPENATIQEHLGDVYLELKLDDEAEEAYRRALELEDAGVDQAEGDVQGKLEALKRRP